MPRLPRCVEERRDAPAHALQPSDPRAFLRSTSSSTRILERSSRTAPSGPETVSASAREPP